MAAFAKITNAENITLALGGKWHRHYGTARCPVHDDHTPSLKIKDDPRKTDGVDVHCFTGCDWRDIKAALINQGLLPEFEPDKQRKPQPVVPAKEENRAVQQLERARWMWSRRQPIIGSPAQTYLGVRGWRGASPPTLGYLPPWKHHHPALIAPFGIPSEIEPGVLGDIDDVHGVHLTLLKLDGGGKAEVEKPKIMVGPSNRWPIVLAPVNDLLGLAVSEGIEDGLSVLQSTGLGVWVAGTAGRMPALADKVPGYVETCTIYLHHDDVGQRHGRELGDRLIERGIEVFMEGLDEN